MNKKFDGYLFSKLNAIGTRSEGPAYFLQQFDYKEYPVIKKVPLWELDPKLHKYLDRKVTIQGKLTSSGIEYKSIALYKASKGRVLNKLELALKLEHDPLWINKQPGPSLPPQCTTFTLRVRWPKRSIWEGTCPTAQLFDFFVEHKGQKIWTWSDDKFFAQVETPVLLPGPSWHEFKGIWKIDANAIKQEGTYSVWAVFLASGQETEPKKFEIKFAQ